MNRKVEVIFHLLGLELSGHTVAFAIATMATYSLPRIVRVMPDPVFCSSIALGRGSFNQPGFWWRFVNSRLPDARCRANCNKPGYPDTDT